MTNTEQTGMAMDSASILATARSGHAPGTWVVWPLRRKFIRNSILRWGGLAVVGLIFFTLAIIAVAPGFFNQRGFSFVFTGTIIILLGMLAFGSLGIAIYDAWRLAHANDYWLVITPDEYVKAEPRGKVTAVPLEYVDAVTLKGAPVPQDTAEHVFTDAPSVGRDDFIFGRAVRVAKARRQRKTPTSLAFLDTRTNREVVVASDAAFDDLHGIEYVLSMQSDAKKRTLSRTRSS